MDNKRPSLLLDNIDAISHAICEGSKAERTFFAWRHFFIADTPELLKQHGITGTFITVRYGVISRHFGKDPDHNLTASHWKELAKEITRPFAISKYEKGYRLFTNAKIGKKWIVVGINVKNVGKNMAINNITTAFGYNFNKGRKEKIVYVSEKASPEQAAVLNRLNSGQYLPAQVGGSGGEAPPTLPRGAGSTGT